jgi:hypothetical protein
MKECIRQFTPCEFRQEGSCYIRGEKDYFCLDEEAYMSEVLENKEKMKIRGMKDVRRIESHIKDLEEYSEICQSAEVLDRIMDATKELKKARLKLMERYELSLEDVLRKE